MTGSHSKKKERKRLFKDTDEVSFTVSAAADLFGVSLERRRDRRLCNKQTGSLPPRSCSGPVWKWSWVAPPETPPGCPPTSTLRAFGGHWEAIYRGNSLELPLGPAWIRSGVPKPEERWGSLQRWQRRGRAQGAARGPAGPVGALSAGPGRARCRGAGSGPVRSGCGRAGARGAPLP